MPYAPKRSSSPASVERRPKPRKRVLWSGIVTYADGAYSINCTIRDLSDSGARIAIPRNAQIPTNFFLINVRDQIAHEASIVWHNGAEVGLSIARTINLANCADPALAFLKRLWLERAAR